MTFCDTRSVANEYHSRSWPYPEVFGIGARYLAPRNPDMIPRGGCVGCQDSDFASPVKPWPECSWGSLRPQQSLALHALSRQWEPMDTIDTESRFVTVRQEIAEACRAAGRDPASVTLVAVSKTFGAETIEPVIAAGQRVFGENRVQEAKAKWPPLKQRHGDIALHLVGALQSNKTKEAVALFDAIHSLDRPSLAEALAKEIARQGRSPTLFVEVNTGGEPQ